MKYKKFRLSGLLFICSLLIVTPVLAQSPAPTDTESQIKGIREAVKEKVQDQLDELQKGSKRAFVGQIGKISDNNLVLETSEGNRNIVLSDTTAIIGTNRQATTADTLKEAAYAIAMGYLEGSDTLDCRRLVLSEKPQPLNKEVAYGKITDISQQGNLITIKNDNKAKTYSVSTSKNSRLIQSQNGKMATIELTKLAKGNTVIAVGSPDANNSKIISANSLYLFPSPQTDVEDKPTSIPTKTAPKTTPTSTPTP